MKVSRKVKRYAAVIVIAIAFSMSLRLYIYWRIESTIIAELTLLQSKGIYVHYKSLDVNAWKTSLRIAELEVKFPVANPGCTSEAKIPELVVEGLSVLPFIFEKELFLSAVLIKRPSLRYANNFKIVGFSEVKKRFLKELEIGKLSIESGTIELIDSLTCERKVNASLDFAFSGLTIKKPGYDSMFWFVGGAQATNVVIDVPDHFYKIALKQITYSQTKKWIHLDSFQVSPTLNKIAFAKNIGHQADQFICTMPELEMNGVEIGQRFKPSFSSRHMAFNFNLKVYRDKRFPLSLRRPRILPVRYLRQLAFALQIDSIRIDPSFISYEEFPEKGSETGTIFFNHLQAGIYNLSNDSIRDLHMNVTSRFMNAGDLQARFMFPLKSKKPYTAEGALTNFSMPGINTMLLPVANIKIESGIMHEMKFQFHYDDFKSEGELEVNYSDLKVLSLRKDAQRSTNKFMSFIMSALVRKNVGDSDKKDKRTGQIHWERDAQKGVLNYWWKSVLSGVKEVYNLDKLGGNKEKEKSQ